MKILKAINYARVSTDDQAENGTSLESQDLACLRKAVELSAQVVQVYHDEGMSGAFLLGRKGLQQALEDIEGGKADLLIVYSISRLSRDVEHQQAIKKRIERAGAKLIICDMPIEDTEEGELMFGISGSFAQYERKLIRKRTMQGRQRRAEEGIMPYRTVSPFGYHIVTKNDVLQGRYPAELIGKYLIIEEEAEIVRELFRRYAGGASLLGLSGWLDAAGIPTRRGASYWKPVVLRSILQNPTYKGLVLVGRRETIHDETRPERGLKQTRMARFRPAEQCIPLTVPALVNDDLWKNCQERLATNQARMSGNPGRRHLLSGVMLCPSCGKRMKGAISKGVLYYRCYQETYCPYRKHTPGSKADGLIRHVVKTFAQSPQLLETKLRVYAKRRQTFSTEVTEQTLCDELKALEAREKTTVEAQIAGIAAGANPAIYAGLFAEIAAQRKRLEDRLTALKAQEEETAFDPKNAAGIIAQAFADVETVLDDPEVTIAEKNRALSLIVFAVHPPVDDGQFSIDLAAMPGTGLTVSQVST